jgi:hypothetical protein
MQVQNTSNFPVTCGSSLPCHRSAFTVLALKWRLNSKKRNVILVSWSKYAITVPLAGFANGECVYMLHSRPKDDVPIHAGAAVVAPADGSLSCPFTLPAGWGTTPL